ncbi:hypothetical protein GEMRC1_007603 [Eukaryota sp. GEM-RC1]
MADTFSHDVISIFTHLYMCDVSVVIDNEPTLSLTRVNSPWERLKVVLHLDIEDFILINNIDQEFKGSIEGFVSKLDYSKGSHYSVLSCVVNGTYMDLQNLFQTLYQQLNCHQSTIMNPVIYLNVKTDSKSSDFPDEIGKFVYSVLLKDLACRPNFLPVVQINSETLEGVDLIRGNDNFFFESDSQIIPSNNTDLFLLSKSKLLLLNYYNLIQSILVDNQLFKSFSKPLQWKYYSVKVKDPECNEKLLRLLKTSELLTFSGDSVSAISMPIQGLIITFNDLIDLPPCDWTM